MPESADRDAPALPPLIPRDVLFGNPERTSPQLSPDGTYLTYLAPDERDVLQVWLRTIGQEDDGAITADKKRGIRTYFWANNSRQVIYLQDADGDENWHLYAVSIDTRMVRDITPFQGIQAQMVARDPSFPDMLLVGMNLLDRRKHDVYRVNLTNGAIELDTENPGNVLGWTTDATFQVRAALAMTSDGGRELRLRESSGAPWTTLRQWGPDDEGHAVGFSADGGRLYVVSDHDANAQRLQTIDLATGMETTLAADDQYDVGGVMVHPTRRTVEAVAFYRDRLEWQALEPDVKVDFAALAQVRQGEYSVSSRDLADKTWLVSYRSDDGPIYYYRYDRASRQATLLFSHQPKLEGLPLASMQPIVYQSRDGVPIHGYLTTPAGVPSRQLPAVLLVHGGPWGRDTWGYDPMVQWLANRGYAVLQMNFRGSAGYGKQFLHAGDREWAGKMHDDVIDGVNWLVQQGVADPKRIAIFGGSYGGFATLVGLTFTPDVFAAGVDLVGPSNIVTLLKSMPPYWAPMRAMMFRRVGDPEADQAFLESRSPLFQADRIKAPLLIGQGANDPRVPQAESEQIVAAMRRAGRPVEYVLYGDEGHGLARPENRLHFYALAEAFLAQHLGGRAEPVGEIAGHSGLIR